jgi:hypothetical protein
MISGRWTLDRGNPYCIQHTSQKVTLPGRLLKHQAIVNHYGTTWSLQNGISYLCLRASRFCCFLRSKFGLPRRSFRAGLTRSPSSRSTDFEVHRNWLAITHSLPISKWYYDVSSSSFVNSLESHQPARRQHLNGVRTKYSRFGACNRGFNTFFVKIALDYPPFFAYFEKLLSIPASLIDSRIVDLANLNYDSWSVIAYQRTTVILAELVLAAALLRCAPSPNVCRVWVMPESFNQICPWSSRPFNPTSHISISIPSSRIPHCRPHTFSVQWFHVRNIALVHPDGTKCTSTVIIFSSR